MDHRGHGGSTEVAEGGRETEAMSETESFVGSEEFLWRAIPMLRSVNLRFSSVASVVKSPARSEEGRARAGWLGLKTTKGK